MKSIYTITREVNDGGWENSCKCFTNLQDAIKYLRKVVANWLFYERKQGNRIDYLQVYETYPNDTFPQRIDFGIKEEGGKITHYEMRVAKKPLFENEKEFGRYPIQF